MLKIVFILLALLVKTLNYLPNSLREVNRKQKERNAENLPIEKYTGAVKADTCSVTAHKKLKRARVTGEINLALLIGNFTFTIPVTLKKGTREICLMDF